MDGRISLLKWNRSYAAYISVILWWSVLMEGGGMEVITGEAILIKGGVGFLIKGESGH